MLTVEVDGLPLPSPVRNSPLLIGIKPWNWSPNRSSSPVFEVSCDEEGPGILTSPSHPPNEANAFMDCTGSRYDVNIGLDDIVVKGPGEPKKASVSVSGVDVEALTLGVDPEEEVTGASELGIVKPSNPSKRELGESWVEAVVTEERALPGTRLGPAVGLPFEKRLIDSGELDGRL